MWTNLDFEYYMPESEKWDQERLDEELNKLGEELKAFYGGGNCSTWVASDIVKSFRDYVHNHPKHKHNCNVNN